MTDQHHAKVSEASWHALDAEDTVDLLGSSRFGLPEEERVRRLHHYGPNEVAGRKSEPWWEEFLEAFAEPLQLLLIAVAVLSAIFGEISDAIAIAVVIVVVAAMETVTEVRAARAIEALKALTAPTARLVGPGSVRDVPAAQVVPGDVVAVESGDIVPADARVLFARGLRVDESTLTGEAHPVGKDERPVADPAALADRSCMLHSGTAVVAGEGRAVVVATGAASQLGKLGDLVTSAAEPPTPLQQALSQLARGVLVAAIAASVLVPVVGLVRGQPWREMVLAGLTVAFATVPEELPVLITVLLAVGGRQLARRGALLRRLRAGETLGAVSTVLTDKTGTLTENRLELHEISGDREEVLTAALYAQAPDGAGREPLESELADAASAATISRRGKPIGVFPFDPGRKLVSRAWENDGTRWLVVAGAPEAVLERCTLGDEERAVVTDKVVEHTGLGLRVIGFARRDLDGSELLDTEQRDQVERGLHYVGFAAFVDPVRKDVPDSVETLTTASVATIVVTGDHAATARAVSTEAGLPAVVRTGAEVDALADADLNALLRHGTVVARATPATKLRIVRCLQHRGEIVAVTGDGANDAPALAAADVGIALGRRGADLACAAAGLVLTDDAYASVVAAIAKGRNITAQLRRAVAFYLGAKLALVTVLLAALALGLPSPFRPIHLVLLEIFMDLGASVAFVAEPAAPQSMRRPPRPPGSGFLDDTVLSTIVTVAAVQTFAVLPTYLVAAALGAGAAGTAAVLAWLAAHALVAWTLRTQPGLSWIKSPAFPAWAGSAVAVGLLLSFTTLGELIDLPRLGLTGFLIATVLVAAAVTCAVLTRRALRLPQRL